MTEVELKEEIENTRNVLNVAVRERWAAGKVLDISRNLDCLIEKYMEMCNQKNGCGTIKKTCKNKKFIYNKCCKNTTFYLRISILLMF